MVKPRFLAGLVLGVALMLAPSIGFAFEERKITESTRRISWRDADTSLVVQLESVPHRPGAGEESFVEATGIRPHRISRLDLFASDRKLTTPRTWPPDLVNVYAATLEKDDDDVFALTFLGHMTSEVYSVRIRFDRHAVRSYSSFDHETGGEMMRIMTVSRGHSWMSKKSN